MPFTLISSTAKAGAANGSTTDPIDTQGAGLISVCLSWFSAGSVPALSDSEGNTWTPQTNYGTGFVNANAIQYHCIDPVVDASHTFTVTGNNSFADIFVMAWSAPGEIEFDSATGQYDPDDNPISAGTLTPDDDNQLFITSISSTGSAHAVNSSYSEIGDIAFSGGNRAGGCAAYKVQTVAGAENPAWTITGDNGDAVTHSTFKFIAPGGGGNAAGFGMGGTSAGSD